MNKYCFLLLSLLFLSACEDELQLEGPAADIPVVFGFISAQDTAHYIRIEKAFLEPGGDATQIAQIPDSLYYENIVVELEKTLTGQRYLLERVDGNAEGFPREEGPFAQAPNYLYKVRNSEIRLTGGEPLRLIIDRGNEKEPVTAETTVLNELEPRSNSPASPVNMAYDRSVNFSWAAGEEARLFDVRLRIHYSERAAGGTFADKELEWILADDLQRENNEERVTYAILGEEFYRFLADNLSSGNGTVRTFSSIDLLITAGGEEFIDFLSVTRANAGLTSAQQLPVYTNISEGRGIFSSRSYIERTGLTLSGPSVDSLRDGQYTRQLNFQ